LTGILKRREATFWRCQAAIIGEKRQQSRYDLLNVSCRGSTDDVLADLKVVCLAKWPMRPLGGRPQMLILSARKRFGL
jgi:hypothetical protein